MQISARWETTRGNTRLINLQPQRINYSPAGATVSFVHLKMSCVSRSICIPLMNRAESPGWRPRVALKSCREEESEERQRDSTSYSHQNLEGERERGKNLPTPAERIDVRAWRQTPMLAVAWVTYFAQLAASSHNEAATPRLGASKQAATAQFKICLFRAIRAQNADLIIRGRMCAAAECLCVCPWLCVCVCAWQTKSLGTVKSHYRKTKTSA